MNTELEFTESGSSPPLRKDGRPDRRYQPHVHRFDWLPGTCGCGKRDEAFWAARAARRAARR